ncbi:hypothetical protein CJJ17_07910 [Gordonia polyisoprenivorans]|nr:hypothetical protein CJJ17_07910 [Gordonia polyisoprenivorans]
MMAESPTKEQLVKYLQELRDTVLWKLDGLDEYDLRRPLTPTGTSLLGMVKHLADDEFSYFGEAFGRPVTDLPWIEGRDSGDQADMFARADESVADIVGWYRSSWEHAAQILATRDLDAPGVVTWWTHQSVTLGRILLHMAVETARHVGQMDILRESVDGAVGLYADNTNIAPVDHAAHRARVQAIADGFRRS